MNEERVILYRGTLLLHLTALQLQLRKLPIELGIKYSVALTNEILSAFNLIGKTEEIREESYTLLRLELNCAFFYARQLLKHRLISNICSSIFSLAFQENNISPDDILQEFSGSLDKKKSYSVDCFLYL